MGRKMLFVVFYLICFSTAHGADAFTRGATVAVLNMLACETREQGTALLDALKTGGEEGMTRAFGELYAQRDSLGRPQCNIRPDPVYIQILEQVDVVPIPQRESSKKPTNWYIIRIYLLSEQKISFLVSILPVREPRPPRRGIEYHI